MSVTTYLSTSCQVLSICILHLVIMNNIEQWRIDSAPWHFLKAGKGGGWVSSAFESQWHQWTVKRSLCALAVLTGGWSICLWCPYLYICTGISWYFLIEQWRDYSLLCQCWLGGPSAFESQWHQWTVKRSLFGLASVLLGGSICLWCPYLYICTGIHLPLVSTCFLYALVFPYIFLLFVCFELALIGDIKKHRVHSACWQFLLGGPSAFESQWHQWTVKRSLCALAVLTGGSICLWCLYLYICTGISYIVRFTWCHNDISLYLPISWLFWMGSHWLHWKAKSSLWALAVLKGGGSPGGSSTDTHTN